jgi:hypothetical protein
VGSLVVLEREDAWASFGEEFVGDLWEEVRGGTETGAPAPVEMTGDALADDGSGRAARGVAMLEFAEAAGDGSCWSAGVVGEDAALFWRAEFFRDEDEACWG